MPKGHLMAAGESAAREPEAPRDKNEPFKPVVVNRNDVDPLVLVRANRGTAGDRDRLILRVFDQFVPAASQSFTQLRLLLGQLADRQEELQAWLRRPWYRRWFRRPPPLQPLTLPAPEPPAEPEDEPGED